MKFKRIMTYKPVYYQIFGDAVKKTIFMKQNDYNLNPKYSVKDVDFTKWQWVGIASYVKQSFQTCVAMLSSAQEG